MKCLILNKTRILLCCCLFGMTGFASAQTLDTLELQNGQMLVGAFISWQKGYVNFSIVDAGTVSVNFQKVNTLSGKLSNYRVETTTGNIYYGTLKTATSQTITVIEKDTAVGLRFEQIVSILPYSKSTLKPLAASMSLGYNYSRSTAIGLVNLDAGVTYSTRKVNLTLTATSSLTHTNHNYSRDRENATTNIFRYLDNRWAIGSRIIYQRNRQQLLDARYQGALGMLYTATKRNNIQLYFFSGLVSNNEITTSGQTFVNVEVPFLLQLDLFRLKDPGLTLSTIQTIFYEVSTHQRIRHEGELRLSWQMTRKFALTAYGYNSYDNAPKEEKAQNLDYGWVLGLKYTM